MRSAVIILAIATASAVAIAPGIIGHGGVINPGLVGGIHGIVGPGAVAGVGPLGVSILDDGRNIGRGNRATDLANLAAAQAATAAGNARVTAEQVSARAAGNAQFVSQQASNAANNAANRATSPLWNAGPLNVYGYGLGW